MTVERSAWGEIEGRTASRFTISNGRGASLVVCDYGAAALQLRAPSPAGDVVDVILGYDALETYRAERIYCGATVGRFANRLRGGRFRLDGVAYETARNDGGNTLHGGASGFDKRLWRAAVAPSEDGVLFRTTSPDGDQGFPGALSATVAYQLTDANVVRIEMRATTDRPTLCNLAHHSYFNLAGAGDVLDHELRIDADFYAPVDDQLIPTGEIRQVEGGPFDFRAPRRIGAALDLLPGGAAARGFDHNYCVRGEIGRLRRAAMARDPASGRGFELWSTEPGLHFYAGGDLDATMIGKSGAPFRRFGGFALETQRFPNGPNVSHAPQSRLDPGEEYRHVMEFRFFT